MVKPVTSWLTKNYGLIFFVQINLWPEFTGFVTGYGLGSWFDDFWKSWLLYRLPVILVLVVLYWWEQNTYLVMNLHVVPKIIITGCHLTGLGP